MKSVPSVVPTFKECQNSAMNNTVSGFSRYLTLEVRTINEVAIRDVAMGDALANGYQ